MKFPLGSLGLPGKWYKSFYNETSGQHNFRDKDSILSAVAINPSSSYPFYKKDMSSNTFVKAMYEWDSQYLANKIKGESNIIIQDTTNHFILWQLKNDSGMENFNLFGCEKGIVFTVFIVTKKWTSEQKINFLQTVYKNRTVGNCCN
jgi:hypothetical protein